nr:hypothetical protein [Tanacetum cinerariifolium]
HVNVAFLDLGVGGFKRMVLANEIHERLVKDIKENDKSEPKPDKIKSKRKAWKSPKSTESQTRQSRSHQV